MWSTLIIGSLAYLAAANDVIERDIVILGGGCTGTYAAVQLSDLNQSVVVIERNDRMGGHTHTYFDPTTNAPVNYGVLFYHDDEIVHSFHERLGVPLSGFEAGDTAVQLADFAQGVALDNIQTGTIGVDYTNELEKYPYLENGYELPDQIPEDLFLPWADYIQKHDINNSAIASFRGPNPAGDPLERLSLYQFNFLNSLMLDQLAGNIVHNANDDNAEIYRKAQEELGAENVLLNSTVTSGSRSSSGIELVVSTPTGTQTIRAKQLVVAAPPQASNLAPIGLDERESNTLSQVGGYPFYAGVVTNTGLPSGFDFQNLGQDTEYHVPDLPYVLHLSPSTTVPGLYTYTYGSLEPKTRAEVEAATAQAIENLQRAFEARGADTTAEPSFLAFDDASPFHPEPSAQSVRDGFFRDMYDLQGYRNTWYVSALFVLNASQLWNNTQALLPDIVAAADAISNIGS